MSIKFVSKDCQEFEVRREVAEMSVILKALTEEIGKTDTIPIPEVDSRTLKKVFEWCRYYKENVADPVSEADRYRTDNISKWDAEFMNVDMELLFSLVMGANYLDIKGLLDLACKTIANMIKGHSPDEVKEKFKIPEDSLLFKKAQMASTISVAN